MSIRHVILIKVGVSLGDFVKQDGGSRKMNLDVIAIIALATFILGLILGVVLVRPSK
jgi:hypothetical protein